MRFTTALLLITVLLTACASTPVTPTYPSHAEYLAATGQTATDVPEPLPMSAPPATAPSDGPSTGKIIAVILLAPIVIPLLLLAAAGNAGSGRYGGYRGVHCKTYTYKDQLHTKCY